jgi:cytochrome P450 family 6
MVFAIFLVILLFLWYYLNDRLFSFWKLRGFKQLKPTFLIGNAGPIIRLKRSMGEHFRDLYDQHKNLRIFGIYFFYRPTLMVTDPKLVQDIMIRDFTSFNDRPMPVDEEGDPLSGEFAINVTKFDKIKINFVQLTCSTFPVKTGGI